MIRPVIRTEQGWVGHFILGSRCLFHLNTLLKCGKRRVIVSTVGNLRMGNYIENEMDSIGADRWYETMVFRAHKCGHYWGINVEKQLHASDLTYGIWAKDKESLPDDVDNMANQIHERFVARFTMKLSAGEKL